LEVSGKLHAPAALPPEKELPDIYWIEGWVDPRTGLHDVKRKNLAPIETQTPTPSAVQSITSRYTDYFVLKWIIY
jgi:hypothetical protein